MENLCLMVYQVADGLTVDIGYMVIGYMVKSVIWSILSWYRFSYTNKYWIYGQILDIWSENLVKLRVKSTDRATIKGLFDI